MHKLEKNGKVAASINFLETIKLNLGRIHVLPNKMLTRLNALNDNPLKQQQQKQHGTKSRSMDRIIQNNNKERSIQTPRRTQTQDRIVPITSSTTTTITVPEEQKVTVHDEENDQSSVDIPTCFDCLLQILSYLPGKFNLSIISIVCKRWYRASRHIPHHGIFPFLKRMTGKNKRTLYSDVINNESSEIAAFLRTNTCTDKLLSYLYRMRYPVEQLRYPPTERSRYIHSIVKHGDIDTLSSLYSKGDIWRTDVWVSTVIMGNESLYFEMYKEEFSSDNLLKSLILGELPPRSYLACIAAAEYEKEDWIEYLLFNEGLVETSCLTLIIKFSTGDFLKKIINKYLHLLKHVEDVDYSNTFFSDLSTPRKPINNSRSKVTQLGYTPSDFMDKGQNIEDVITILESIFSPIEIAESCLHICCYVFTEAEKRIKILEYFYGYLKSHNLLFHNINVFLSSIPLIRALKLYALGMSDSLTDKLIQMGERFCFDDALEFFGPDRFCFDSIIATFTERCASVFSFSSIERSLVTDIFFLELPMCATEDVIRILVKGKFLEERAIKMFIERGCDCRERGNDSSSTDDV